MLLHVQPLTLRRKFRQWVSMKNERK
jgi:hypothetical protein